MSQSIKYIRPRNLLSFGPAAEQIELRDLNILIGANGSGKSNLIEIIGLLRSLTERKPWARVTETGGHLDWLWKSAHRRKSPKFGFDAGIDVVCEVTDEYSDFQEVDYTYRLGLDAPDWSSTFRILEEAVFPYAVGVDEAHSKAAIWREDKEISYPLEIENPSPQVSRLDRLPDDTSILSQTAWSSPVAGFKYVFERIGFYRDWVFGSGGRSRGLERLGLEAAYLEEDGSNLAHVLNFILTHEAPALGNNLRKAFQDFSNDAKDIETRIREGFIQLRVRETSGISTPASRLSDGTLRWLALLAVLLNPAPPPVICIEEPELGLHPDILPTLSDLLRDASTRTQLILTTHSRTLVECFSDDPESICVCEKFNGATEIRRLQADQMKLWLEKYSLGQLWSSGEIGGNRW